MSRAKYQWGAKAYLAGFAPYESRIYNERFPWRSLASIGCIGNLANCNKVFGMLRSLVNPHPYGLTHKDADSFKLKGFEE